MILEELLGDDLPYAKKAVNNQTSLLGRVFGHSREARIARMQSIFGHLKVRLLVMHVDPTNATEYELLVTFRRNDITRIGNLIGEIRDIVRDLVDVSADHKRRLLKIVNQFEGELDKPKSSFRVFLDGMVEASVALGDAGKNVKPAVDRIREIFSIAGKNFAENPQLEGPAEQKRLPPPNEANVSVNQEPNDLA